MLTVLFAYVVFFLFASFVAKDLCTSGCRQNYYLTPHPVPLLPIFFPTHNSFFNTSDIYLKSARA